MKNWVIGSIAAVAFAVATVSPAMADVVRPDGATTGHPILSESNTGSAQGLTNRSDTGTTNKFTHDGTRPIWVG